jgi:hypothetical protein
MQRGKRDPLRSQLILRYAAATIYFGDRVSA